MAGLAIIYKMIVISFVFVDEVRTELCVMKGLYHQTAPMITSVAMYQYMLVGIVILHNITVR